MNGSGVPQDQIAGLGAHFDRLATSFLEPVNLFRGKAEPVGRAPSLSLRVVGLEEGLVECTGPLQDN